MGDAHEHNEIRLKRELNQSRDDLKTQTTQLVDLTKQLSKMNNQKDLSESQLLEMTKKNETMATRCLELEIVNVGLTQEVEQSKTLNETLKESLKDAQVDFIFTGDKAFERDKAQALCISPDLSVSRMDFFKIGVDGQLVDMDEASPEVENSRGMMDDNTILEAQANNHEIWI